jgi:class 3 adenylate cyclase/pimeloyl-ACP methyl ester carboxylesterase
VSVIAASSRATGDLADQTVPVSDVPKTHFARLGGDRIAYQVVGDGPVDLVWVPGLSDALDIRWEYPIYAAFLRRLASFSRLVMLDRRGTGASDPVSLEALPSWEGWAEDAMAVLDAVGSERAVLLGSLDAGPTAIMIAATRPERTHSLITFNTAARVLRDDDYPWGQTPEEAERAAEFAEEHWGGEVALSGFGDQGEDDLEYLRWAAKDQRMSCGPREAGVHMRQLTQLDIRHVLPSIRVPTLVMHRKDAPFLTVEAGRHLAEHIPGARFVELPGTALPIYPKPNAPTLDHIEAFATGTSPAADTNRILATILFTDIVGSTERAAELGDRRWRNVLETYLGLNRTIVEEHQGRVVKVDGDGMLATFDGPGRAVRCVSALVEGIRPLGLEIRAGLHTGEVEVMGDDVGGIAVHIAARVMAEAGPGELLVSGVIPPLVAGSGMDFDDRGEHELKGVPGTWRLFVVEN